MLLLHLSDLHLSRYGETRTWSESNDGNNWEVLHEWRRWSVQGAKDKRDRPDRIRLLDPEGVVHLVKKWSARRRDKSVNELISLAIERHRTSMESLTRDRPSAEDLNALLKVDPSNTNLRLLQVVDRVLPLEPDLVLISGDLTDNGFGYGLVEHYFAPWIERGRLFVVPGNHDTYDMFPRKGRRNRALAKEESYARFAETVGCAPGPGGAYVRRVGDIAVVGLSSCKPPIAPLSASGEVSREQLVWLHELAHDIEFQRARVRLCLVHHHLLRMPFELGKRTPLEVGMRLRNAPQVMRACTEAKIDIIFNGHRHHGYLVQLPGHPMVVSGPSSTQGCKSSQTRYVWMVDLSERYPYPKAYHFTKDPAVKEKGNRSPSTRPKSSASPNKS